MTKRITIGIDPGAHGAIAVLGLGEPIVHDCPSVLVKVGRTRRTRCDPAGMSQLMGRYLVGDPDVHAWLEQVSAHPKQGVSSMFAFGQAFGIWLGILGALVVPYTLVTPQSWKRSMMPGMSADKGASRVRAGQLWPRINDNLGPRSASGRADALLIAEYGRRSMQW